MKTTLPRNGTIRIVVAFFSLFAFTIALSFGAYYLSGLRKAQLIGVAREHPIVVQSGPAINEPSPRRRPPTKQSQLMALATKAAEETTTAAEMLLHEIEPASVPKDIDLGAANRDDLEALRGSLETATAQAATFMPRYLALLNSQRDKVEKDARSLNAERESIAKLLETIDQSNAEIAGVMSQVLMARTDFYRTYATYVALLVAEHGNYKVVNGQFIFPIQRTVDRYNIAAHAMAVAAKRMAELELERRRLMQLQLEQWRQLRNQDQ